MASFHSFGTVPVDNEKLIMLVTVGTSRSVHCLSRRVGMGSNAHVLDGDKTILILILAKSQRYIEKKLLMADLTSGMSWKTDYRKTNR